MRLAVSWWDPTTGGSQQAIRGNTRALQDAGHDVDLYLASQIGQLEAHADEYDAVVIPYVHYHGDLAAFDDTHLHLQLGGYPAEPQPAATQQSLQAADTVSCLDPSILGYYQQWLDIDIASVALIPNPPNRALFDRQPAKDAGEHALVVKLGSAQKGAGELYDIAKAARTETFVVHHTGENGAPDLPDNVWLRPPVPFVAMPRQYGRARLVVNPSTQDVLPNTAFEAFLSGRPYVCRPEAIGQVQSIPAAALEPGEFGRSVDWWHGVHRAAIGAGEHVVLCEEPEEFGQAILELVTNDREWRRVVEAADEWLESWGAWDWESKGHALTAVIEQGRPLQPATA